MALIALIALGLLGWAYFSGRLAGWRASDAIAAAVVLLGVRLLATGAVFAGLVTAGLGLAWMARHWARIRLAIVPLGQRADPDEIEDAQKLLGVMPWAEPEDIHAAYRRQVGDADAIDPNRAERLAAARDLLLSQRAVRR